MLHRIMIFSLVREPVDAKMTAKQFGRSEEQRNGISPHLSIF